MYQISMILIPRWPDAGRQHRLERLPGLRRHPAAQPADTPGRRLRKDRRRLARLPCDQPTEQEDN